MKIQKTLNLDDNDNENDVILGKKTLNLDDNDNGNDLILGLRPALTVPHADDVPR